MAVRKGLGRGLDLLIPKDESMPKKSTGKNKDTQETLKADFETKTNDYIVATTVDLLSTWVDIKPLLNVVFFRHIASPILFYQMVGRWTRLHPESGKYMFRIYDYTKKYVNKNLTISCLI